MSYWEFLENDNPQKSFTWLFNRIQESMEQDRVEVVKKKQVEGITSKGSVAGSSNDAAPAPKGRNGGKGKKDRTGSPSPDGPKGDTGKKGDQPKGKGKKGNSGKNAGGDKPICFYFAKHGYCEREGCAYAHRKARPDEVDTIWPTGKGKGSRSPSPNPNKGGGKGKGGKGKSKDKARPASPAPVRSRTYCVQFAKSGSCKNSQERSSPHIPGDSPFLKEAKRAESAASRATQQRMGAAKSPKSDTRPPGSVTKIEEVAAPAVAMPCVGIS